MSQGALEIVMEQELELARLQLEAPERVVLVVGIVLEGELGLLARSVTYPATRRHGVALANALQLEVDRLRRLAAEPSG